MSDTGAHSSWFSVSKDELTARLRATSARLERKLARNPLYVCMPMAVYFTGLARVCGGHSEPKPVVYGHMVDIEVDGPVGEITKGIHKLLDLVAEHRFAPMGTQRVFFQTACGYDTRRKVICLTLNYFMSAESE